MEELRMRTIEEMFNEIATGNDVELPSSRENDEVIFQRMESEVIQERSRRATAYREAAKIYLTF